jgi:NAD(P)-dependent dehydrogenase (short-subunit alcohol dehydrogenase family)
MRNTGMKRSHLAAIGGIAFGAWAIARSARARFSFAGKVVIISGGSRGLGLVIGRQLADEGARIALLARDQDELARAETDLKSRGAEVLVVPCDLTKRAQIALAVEKIIARFGGVDVLVNNAGVIEVGPLDHMTREDFQRSLAVHFWAPFELTMRVRPEMKKRGGGRIINISSIGGKIAVPHFAPYVAGKFALTGFSDSTRAELARENILITTVAPGMMRTGSHVNASFKGDHSAEFAWFSFSNGLPLLSMSAERATAKIIAASRRGQPSLTLTVAARLAISANALVPNLFGYAMKIANRLLPQPSGRSGNELRLGWQSRDQFPERLIRHLDAATARNNGAPGPARTE